MMRSQYTPEFRRHFWERFVWCDGCLVWTGYRLPSGHGRMGVNGSQMLTHRLAYTLIVGPIPDGMDICHQCDNPPCGNPVHLFPGTERDNMQDAGRKLRLPHGQGHRNAKLTDALVREIRDRHIPGQYGYKRLAKEYGVSNHAVRNILEGITWKHLYP